MILIPVQEKRLYYDDDAQANADALEDALYSVISAMDGLKGKGEFDEIFAALSDVAYDMKHYHEELEEQAGREYRNEMDDLERGYWASVM